MAQHTEKTLFYRRQPLEHESPSPIDISASLRRESLGSSRHGCLPSVELPHTPPHSLTGSPLVKREESIADGQAWGTLLARPAHESTPDSSPIRLPSLTEFDQGVGALARPRGSLSYPSTPAPSTTTLPNIRQAVFDQRPLPSIQNFSPQLSHNYPSWPDDGLHHTNQSIYPSPPPDGEARHCNKKYTTEECDFIIYAWHDQKRKWSAVQRDFAELFGREPERTIQGIQANYYRMNLHIPEWDRNGYLVFNNEDDLEPRHTAVKCRAKEAAQMSLGLAQRYPERLVNYPWVDMQSKRQAQDWANKRIMQMQQRRERRRLKEAYRNGSH